MEAEEDARQANRPMLPPLLQIRNHTNAQLHHCVHSCPDCLHNDNLREFTFSNAPTADSGRVTLGSEFRSLINKNKHVLLSKVMWPTEQGSRCFVLAIWIAEAASECLFFCPLGIKQLGRRTSMHTVHFIYRYILYLFKYTKMGFHSASKPHTKEITVYCVCSPTHLTRLNIDADNTKKGMNNKPSHLHHLIVVDKESSS